MAKRHAPADPIFWMHHAEIDRIWEIWRSTHPDSKPNLSGADSILDPWANSVVEVLNTQNFRYGYASLEL